MKAANKKLICSILALILSISIPTGSALALSEEEIFRWVANRLEIKIAYEMPEVLLVSREELRRAFIKSNEKSLQRWVGMYGEETASQIMDQYLNEVIGLFDPKTQVIYVGSFLESCRQQSIVAHEFTHYFQVLEYGTPDLDTDDADALRFSQEMQAGKVENEFISTFCLTPEAE
jgi:hypothetical protein